MLSSRAYNQEDFHFLKECVRESPEWQKEECHELALEDYMRQYEHLNGRWLIWEENQELIGISFTLDCSPSNSRPWLGTLLLHPKYRLQGNGKRIINEIAKKWKSSGEKIAYSAIPIMNLGWSTFLSKCGFEQYKIEKEANKTYLLFIKPL